MSQNKQCTPLPAATPMKPGSAVSEGNAQCSFFCVRASGQKFSICGFSVSQTFPFFGVVPAILNESGEELEGPSEGYLVRVNILIVG